MHVTVWAAITKWSKRYHQKSKKQNPTSAGNDEISSSLLKEVSNYILEPLTHIFGRSMAVGFVPKDLKIAKELCLYLKQVIQVTLQTIILYEH